MPGRISGRSLSCAAGLALGVVWAGGAWAGGQPSGMGVERRVALPGSRAERLLIAEPGARTSLAVRAVAAGAGKVDRSDEGVTRLTNRVLVGTADRAGLARAARGALRAGLGAAAPVSVRGVEGAPGFSVVEVGSVGEAVELAERLAATGAYGSVELDVEPAWALRTPTEGNLANGTIWHLRNTVTPIADVNADGAWGLGYSGMGVVMGVIEGGFQHTHPDLSANYNVAASQVGGSTSHGTSVAGIAGAAANGIGAVGLAYNAQLTKQIFGASATNAAAFGFMNDVVDLKNNSWGPSDNGTVWFMSAAERTALEAAVTTGRGGLGTIFCWAAGNGGLNDRVDYDPYASSRFTFAIGAVGEFDTEAIYNELGSSMLVVTHSDGDWAGGQRGTYTTTTTSAYTSSFGGTSSAAPLGMGAIALALEANPALTWRDVLHLLVQTSRKCDPADTSWSLNGAGHDISYKFGFGAVDAGALCAAAAAWLPVGPEVMATSGVQAVGEVIPDNNATGLTRTYVMAEDVSIEAVELVLTADHGFVGDLAVEFESPQGTVSVVATARANDGGNDYLNGYLFTSHRPFGESSAGTWTVRVKDLVSNDVGTWESFELRVYGTSNTAACGPADCDADGAITIDDVDCFVTAFLAQGAAADCDGDGNVNLDDIDCFVAAFLAGCP